MQAAERIYVAGHRGLVGSAICRALREAGHPEPLVATRSELDLTDPAAVERWFQSERPHVVYLAAAKVGGIHANDTEPADFLYDNLMIAANVIHAAHRHGTRKLLFLGSTCIYPKHAAQPLVEDALLSGPLEPTNEAYAVAKIAGIKLCQAYRRQHGADFISGMPTNLYGPNDNFDLQSSHVLPALLRKIHDAKSQGLSEVTLWGSGTPRREFLHVDDCARACLHLVDSYSDEAIVNIGCGEDVTILELAQTIARVVGWTGEFVLDRSKPDGTPRKLVDITRIRASGWEPRIDLESGIRSTYEWFLDNVSADESSPVAGGS